MTDLATLTDEELVELEEGLYDMEISVTDVWEQRDEILWEMNRRGLMGKKKT